MARMATVALGLRIERLVLEQDVVAAFHQDCLERDRRERIAWEGVVPLKDELAIGRRAGGLVVECPGACSRCWECQIGPERGDRGKIAPALRWR